MLPQSRAAPKSLRVRHFKPFDLPNQNKESYFFLEFLKMDDQYTTNNYVALVRDITVEQAARKRNKDDALM